MKKGIEISLHSWIRIIFSSYYTGSSEAGMTGMTNLPIVDASLFCQSQGQSPKENINNLIDVRTGGVD